MYIYRTVMFLFPQQVAVQHSNKQQNQMILVIYFFKLLREWQEHRKTGAEFSFSF